ncbi:MAG TPA: ABC transporter substrate-binding protein [Candidatus Sulfotelmatobacter sp.]|nr:ABC transporter substrate-binding protein [Candidatus Sulfotelmatobacter sp.]
MCRTRRPLGISAALGATAWALAGLLIPGPAPAQRPPVKVGLLYSTTGVYAGPSRDGINGFKLAFDEVNNEVAGRKVEVIIEDDQAQPAVALTKTRKLVERDRVNVLAGIIWSPNAVAVRDYVHESKVPLVISEGAARVLTQERRSPYIFRSSFAGAQMTRPFGAYACKALGYKKVAVIGFDSVFGREEADAFETGCSESGGKVVLKVFPPVETADFGTYLAQVAAASPDAVWAIWSGAAAIRFHQQYKEFGLKGKFPLIGFGALVDDAVLRAVGDTALGVVTNYFYVTTLDLPENRRFVQAYRQKYGEEPGIFANGGYMAARVIREAAAPINGDVENTPKFLEALRKVHFDSPRGPFRLDPYQNPIENVYIQKVDRVGGKVANVVVDTLRDVEQYWPKGKPQP